MTMRWHSTTSNVTMLLAIFNSLFMPQQTAIASAQILCVSITVRMD